jgi:hypothetical protein
MTAAYSIEPMACSLCEAERSAAFWEEANARYPGLNLSERNLTQEEWSAFHKEWNLEHPSKEQMCFEFVADCGGDAISLCHECLARIAQRVHDQEPASTTRWYAHEETPCI